MNKDCQLIFEAYKKWYDSYLEDLFSKKQPLIKYNILNSENDGDGWVAYPVKGGYRVLNNNINHTVIIPFTPEIDLEGNVVNPEKISLPQILDSEGNYKINYGYKITYYDKNNEVHRLDKPAYYTKGNNGKTDIEYVKHGKLHRLDGPACLSSEINKKDFGGKRYPAFYIEGKRYPEDEYWNLVNKFKPEDRQDAIDLLSI